MTDELKALADLLAKATPGPWECDSEKGENVYGSGPDHGENYHYSLILAAGPDGKWMTLFDSCNSDAASIEEDYDEDYHRAWDAVAEANASAIVASVNFLRDNLPAIIEQRAEIERLKQQLSNSIQFAGGQSPHIVGSGSISAALNPSGEA